VPAVSVLLSPLLLFIEAWWVMRREKVRPLGVERRSSLRKVEGEIVRGIVRVPMRRF